MELLTRLKNLFISHFKVKVSDVNGLVNSMDVDKDGYIDAGELIELIHSVKVKL